MLDCRTLEHRTVALPGDVVICVVHSGVPRALVTSAYNERREDCERAVAAVRRQEPDVRALRDVDLAMLRGRNGPRSDRRTTGPPHHRGERAGAGHGRRPGAGDEAAVGALFAASHASLRDLFEVSCPELDVLVEIADATPGSWPRA